MAVVEILNAWSSAWSGAMLKSLVEASALLVVVLLVWLPIRRRLSTQLSYGLFLIVLARAAVPLPLVAPATIARLSPWRLFDSVAGRNTDGAPGVVSAGQPTPIARIDRAAPGAELRPGPLPAPTRPLALAESALPAKQAATPPQPTRPSLALSAWLMLAWAAVVVMLASRFVWVHVQMARRLRNAEVLDPASLRVDYERLCQTCGLGLIPVASTPRVATPAVWGLLRPRILLPPGLTSLLTPGQLTWVLLHELVHIRRRDLWVATVQRLVQIVYVFHPAVWAVNRLIDVHREFACDDSALALAVDVPRRDCGAGFLTVVERASSLPSTPLALGLFGSHTLVRSRLMRILDSQRTLHRRLSARAASLLAAAALVILPDISAQEAPPAPASDKPAAPAQAAIPPAQGVQAETADIMDFRVVDAQTGLPLAGVAIQVRIDRDSTNTTTNELASVPVVVPGGKVERVSIWASKDGYVPISVTWNGLGGPLDLPVEYTLKLERGTTIGGIIRDEDDRAVEGATVYLLVPGTDVLGQPRPRIWEHAVKTDAEGRWHSDIMPSKLDEIWIRLSHPDYASDTTYGKTPPPPVERLRDQAGVMVLKRGATVTGRVRDAEGKPIRNAHVTQGADRFGSHYPDTTTDAEGRFVFRNVAPGKLVLTVQAAGHAPELKEVLMGTAAEHVEFRLGPGRTIRARIVDRDGQPVPGVMLTADTWRGYRSLSFHLSTDNEGRWRWDEAPDDDVQFNFGKPGFMYSRLQPLGPAEREQTMTLDRPLTVRGTVTDAYTGKSIERFTVLTAIDWRNNRPPDFRRDQAFPVTGGRYEVRFDQPYPRHVVRIEANGYFTEDSRGFKDNEGDQVHDFKLRPGGSLTGVARRPDGSPLAGAEVFLVASSRGLGLKEGRLPEREFTLVGRRMPDNRMLAAVTTGADGRFRFPPQAGPAAVVVVDDLGIGRRTAEQLAENPDVRVEPWGRIEGTLRIGSKPGRDQDVAARVDDLGDLPEPRISSSYRARSDADGNFVIDRVVPGPFQVYRFFPIPQRSGGFTGNMSRVDVPPGGTGRVVLGGTGRMVIGRIVGPGGTALTPDMINHLSQLSVALPAPPAPPDFRSYSDAKKQAWYAAFRRTAQGRTYYEPENTYCVVYAPDRTFRIDDVPPGRYHLTISLSRHGLFPLNSSSASIQRQVIVPDGRGEEPFDVGDLELTLRDARTVEVGQEAPAPALETRSLDGTPVRLADLNGKYVLLHFWAAGCAPCLKETPHLKATFDAFGNDARLAMIGLSLDADRDTLTRYVQKEALGWTQVFLDPAGDLPATRGFGVQTIPSIWLIGPDGRVVAKDLRGEAIKDAVARALGGPR